MDHREHKIRNRAHALWEEAGQPHGQHHEHWVQAESEVDAEGATEGDAEAGSGAAQNEGLPTPDTVSAIDTDSSEQTAPIVTPPPIASKAGKPSRTKKAPA